MYKVIKYFSNQKNFFNIAGIILITFAMFMITKQFINYYVEEPVSKQVIVISKFTKNNFDISNPLKDSTNYFIIAKDEQGNLLELETNKMEYNYIEEDEFYIISTKGNLLLYTINSLQDDYLLFNNLDKAEITITNDDLNKALAVVNNTSSKKDYASHSNKEDITNDYEDKNNQNEDSSDKKDNEIIDNIPDPNKESNNNDINQPNDDINNDYPSDSNEYNNEEDESKDNNNIEEENSDFSDMNLLKSRILNTNNNETSKIIIESLTEPNYTSTIVYDNQEISCSNITNDIGFCDKLGNKTVWTIDGLPSNTIYTLNVYSDTITSETDIMIEY